MFKRRVAQLALLSTLLSNTSMSMDFISIIEEKSSSIGSAHSNPDSVNSLKESVLSKLIDTVKIFEAHEEDLIEHFTNTVSLDPETTDTVEAISELKRIKG